MKTKVIAGQPSWLLASDKVKVAVTATGGHLAPAKFRLGRKTIEPFSVAPWAREKPLKTIPPMLRVLRGDFFCAPFGGGEDSYRGERHPPHGETANARWSFRSLRRDPDRTTLHLSLNTRIRKGRVDKFVQLRDGQTVIYCQHLLSGMRGAMSLGHHAMLKFPEKGLSSVSTSRLQLGQVSPEVLEDPASRGYSSLKPGAFFARLESVPSLYSGKADLGSYPARRGFEDLVMISHRDKESFAWTAVTFPGEGYVWFSLKNPRVLQNTVFWISNGGRHYPPWNSRHVRVMGVEDVTSYFHYGLQASARPNPWNRRGIPTALRLSDRRPLAVNYIMGVAPIPGKLRRVKKIRQGKSGVTLVSEKDHEVTVDVDLSFLQTPSLYETK